MDASSPGSSISSSSATPPSKKRKVEVEEITLDHSDSGSATDFEPESEEASGSSANVNVNGQRETTESFDPGERNPSFPPPKFKDGRTECQYGVKCYRRNLQHLLDFSHQIVEKIFLEMNSCKNFCDVPSHLLRSGMERKTVLEQVQALRDHFRAEATSSSKEQSRDSSISETEAASSSSASQTSQLQQIRDLKRKKYETEKSCTSGKSPTMLEKWEASKPFNLFLTKVTEIPEEREGVFSASFSDLFDPSFGEIKALLHVNFMIDPDWVLKQYEKAGISGVITRLIFDGETKELAGLTRVYPWIKVFGVKSPFPFGHHHTKMSIVQYQDLSARFFIYTANLIDSDWDNRTQGIWISPKCPKISGSGGDSVTKFRFDLIQYLSTYPVQAARAWVDVIKGVDCSEIKVYFVGSVPITSSSASNGFQYGISKMEKILISQEVSSQGWESDPSWPLMIQCSSIGTLGPSIGDWVQSELAVAFAGKDRVQQGPINVIYPSHSNVKNSFEGLAGGGCLPYSASTHHKQIWLEKHLCQWKASRSSRSRAVPHIKCYLRASPDYQKLSWFHLTSANLSKAAWGKYNKNRDRLSLMSWEAGVLFLPQIMISKPYFSISENESEPPFPLPIDLPPVKYEKHDKPFFFETLQALILQRGASSSSS